MIEYIKNILVSILSFVGLVLLIPIIIFLSPVIVGYLIYQMKDFYGVGG